MNRLVRLQNLGRLSYSSALEIQRKSVQQRLQSLSANGGKNELLDSLLIVEHSPVYTIGIRTSGYNEVDEAKLTKLGAEYFKTDRGGLITFHGPGQLVAYPILNLENYSKSVKWYVCALQKSLISTCRKFGLEASTCEHTGVWIRENKIAAIGINCRRYITSHGIALNCNVDLTWFQHIVPCGIEDRGVTSLSSELGYEVTISQALPKFLEAFEDAFQCKIITTEYNNS